MREREDDGGNEAMDLRLYLRGRNGRCVTMELDSGVLCGSSAFFADIAPDVGFTSNGGGASGKRIEVDGVENVERSGLLWSLCTNLNHCAFALACRSWGLACH